MQSEADDYDYWMRDVSPAFGGVPPAVTEGEKDQDPFVLRLKRRLK